MTRLFKPGRHFDYGPTKSDSYEGRMVKQYLRNIIRCATALEEALEDNDDLPGWVNAKIVTADDRLSVATQYMLYEIRRHQKDGDAKYKAESWSGRFQPSGPAPAAKAAVVPGGKKP